MVELGSLDWRLPFLVHQVRYLLVSALIEAMWITCRWLNLTQLTTWESAATVLSSFDFGRLLVVLFKGRHLCRLTATRGSVFEICEIGEQGVLAASLEATSTLRRKALLGCG
jgi:hypothetical protein